LEIPGFGQITGNGFSTVNQFFVLEGETASAKLLGRFVPACEPIVNGAVSVTPSGATISAAFTPKFGLTTSQAASLCGYSSFNWYQLVTANPYPNLFLKDGKPLKTPHIDPPLGGYDYQKATGGDDNRPFYLNNSELALLDNGTSLGFIDTPSVSLLKPGEFVSFTTSLVGVLADDTWDTLYSFAWKSNFNGTAGGVSVIKNLSPEDPNSGTGGIFDVVLDLNPEDIPEVERNLMEADGSRNASTNAVPGPLPALGIGIAFAWSRKLRGRIRSVNRLMK